jgi:hypothetical protein
MRCRSLGFLAVSLVAVFAASLAVPSFVFGQGGIAVDADGVLKLKATDQSGQLTKQQIAAAKASLNTEAAKRSNLRCVSLNRLEQFIRDHQNTVTDEARYLAGLLRVHYVFFYPESGDIVLAGPAEGWRTDSAGRVVGIQSGRPVIQLQDLCVALRSFPSGGEPMKLIGCSIDPTQEGLAAMQRFLRSHGSGAMPGDTQYIVQSLQTSLGLQTVTVNGVSPKTHFAQVMVEADYRMKLIGIGLERPPVKLVSWVARATPGQVARNALVRWFFTPDYQCVRTSDDGLAMQLVGDGVKVVGEDELVANNGQRRDNGSGDHASQEFVASFTKVYSELADKSPVFAELRNLIDLSVVAAYLQHENLYVKSGLKMDVLGDEKAISVEIFNAPKQVASAVNAIWRGHQLLTPIGGGVEINALMALAPEKRLPDKDDKVAKLRKQMKLELAKGRWWWD